MIDKLVIISKDDTIFSDNLFDEQELLKRSNELKHHKVKPLSRENFYKKIEPLTKSYPPHF